MTLTFIFSHAHEELEHFAMCHTHCLLQGQYWWQRMPTRVQQFVWCAMKCSLHLHSNYTCCLSWVWVISQILILSHHYLSPFAIIDMWWWWASNIFQNGLKWLHYRKNSPWDINLNKLHLHHFPPFLCYRKVDLPTRIQQDISTTFNLDNVRSNLWTTNQLV